MPASLYFVLKYFSFTFTIHLAYSDTRLYQHNLLGPFDEDITEFECIFKRNLIYGYQRPEKKILLFILRVIQVVLFSIEVWVHMKVHLTILKDIQDG